MQRLCSAASAVCSRCLESRIRCSRPARSRPFARSEVSPASAPACFVPEQSFSTSSEARQPRSHRTCWECATSSYITLIIRSPKISCELSGYPINGLSSCPRRACSSPEGGPVGPMWKMSQFPERSVLIALHLSTALPFHSGFCPPHLGSVTVTPAANSKQHKIHMAKTGLTGAAFQSSTQ